MHSFSGLHQKDRWDSHDSVFDQVLFIFIQTFLVGRGRNYVSSFRICRSMELVNHMRRGQSRLCSICCLVIFLDPTLEFFVTCPGMVLFPRYLAGLYLKAISIRYYALLASSNYFNYYFFFF